MIDKNLFGENIIDIFLYGEIIIDGRYLGYYTITREYMDDEKILKNGPLEIRLV